MSTILKQALSPFSREQMFDLINDVQRYPEFIPWCQQTEILQNDPGQLKATLSLSKGPLKYSFTTLNALSRPQQMTMKLVDGPFSHFDGLWLFEQVGLHTSVQFSLNYAFRSRLLTTTAGPIFFKLADQLVDVFMARAHGIYGTHAQ